ncbi:CiaD-like domain-containing protein [Helicobacter canis]|uniref:Campylobacter invasion antigen D C-terminal domain-containing protein n=1 Tax=Helicobacter canis TaxID=29419 RepID=A0A377J5F8_9HELI|nr:hypothetical protein [Helicobacter canis]STO97608.1 Uncharacterised protein [Helicobacter canis]
MGDNTELKDLILQTLDEVARDPNDISKDESIQPIESMAKQKLDSSDPSPDLANTPKPKMTLPKTSIESSPIKEGKIIAPSARECGLSQESLLLLENLREKLLVLFEGLKMPELQDTQNKLDLVVRFLQYQLCMIDEILQKSK